MSDQPTTIFAVTGYIGKGRMRGEWSTRREDCNRPCAEYVLKSAPSPDVAALIERVTTAQDMALAFSDILTTETLSGRTEVMAFCQRLERFLFPAILAALARKGGA